MFKEGSGTNFLFCFLFKNTEFHFASEKCFQKFWEDILAGIQLLKVNNGNITTIMEIFEK